MKLLSTVLVSIAAFMLALAPASGRVLPNTSFDGELHYVRDGGSILNPYQMGYIPTDGEAVVCEYGNVSDWEADMEAKGLDYRVIDLIAFAQNPEVVKYMGPLTNPEEFAGWKIAYVIPKNAGDTLLITLTGVDANGCMQGSIQVPLFVVKAGE